MEAKEKVQQSFPELQADTDDLGLTEIESLCMNCHDNGSTKLLLTRIPFFKEVILSSFACEHCGFSDNELQPGSRIQEKGVKYKCTIENAKDQNRQVVLSNTATVSVPELEFEMPPNKGVLTTVEGLIEKAITGLEQDQPVRRALDEATADKIDAFIGRLKSLRAGESPFTVLVDDPTGNSFIENPYAPKKDEALTISHYTRTREQDEHFGCLPAENPEETKEGNIDGENEDNDPVNMKDQVMQFQSNCPNCNSPCETNMKMVDIPYFKEVVIMATNCDACGSRDSEVKSGGGIEEKGKKITLRLTDSSDLSRDVLKSETSGIEIPELELSMDRGTLGGKFTTIEGLLTDIKNQLMGSQIGDGAEQGRVSALQEFCKKLDKIITGERLNVHFVLDDPAGNSYVQNVYAPDADPEMEIEEYERDFDQNEELGLNDMKTENYSEDA